MTKFEELKEIIANAEVDHDKFHNKRNAAAGVRLRAAYQLIKTVATEGRSEVTELKNAGK